MQRWLPPSPSELLNYGIAASIAARRTLLGELRLTPDRALGRRKATAPNGKSKTFLYIDEEAENNAALFLQRQLPDVRILGEETLWQGGIDLTTETQTVAILDMVDGSDLVERELCNWCSAMVFFQPHPVPKILCALVHDARGEIYTATDAGAFLIIQGRRDLLRLRGPKEPERDQPHMICFYNQNLKHFASVPVSFEAWAEKLEREGKAESFRIQTLAGNPMMAKLANGEHIQAVFEHVGQFPHDAVPGAYIGIMAGAALVDLNGKRMTPDDLAKALLKSSESPLKYVLASNDALATELASWLALLPAPLPKLQKSR